MKTTKTRGAEAHVNLSYSLPPFIPHLWHHGWTGGGSAEQEHVCTCQETCLPPQPSSVAVEPQERHISTHTACQLSIQLLMLLWCDRCCNATVSWLQRLLRLLDPNSRLQKRKKYSQHVSAAQRYIWLLSDGGGRRKMGCGVERQKGSQHRSTVSLDLLMYVHC